MKTFSPSFAPHQLLQSFDYSRFYQQNGQIGFMNFNLGTTRSPRTEQRILDEVGSYGRQIGRIGDTLEVLLRHVDVDKLSRTEQDTISIFRGQIASIRQIKEEEKARDR